MGTKQNPHLLYEAIQQLGWSNPAEIASFVRRLERGLPAEDELCVIFRWLGQCLLVHKLDQFQYPPGAWKLYRVPDLLAVFDVDGAIVPVLIEVKVSADRTLSWKPEYLASLQRYADLLNLPLLVAWKHHSLWALFEAVHLRKAKKNLNISFSEAFRQTLLGLLAGDFSFTFRADVGAHFKIRKLKDTTGGFEGRIEEAYFLNARGERHSGAGGIFHLFNCIEQVQEVKETQDHVLMSFVVSSSDQAEFAHRALVIMLDMFGEGDSSLGWRQIFLKSNSLRLGHPRKRPRKTVLMQRSSSMCSTSCRQFVPSSYHIRHRATRDV